jgi:glutamine synthetase
VRTAEDLPEGVEVVAVCTPDNVGRLIGKRIPVDRWPSVRARGLAMPNYHLITGIENRPIKGLAVTGPHTGFPNGILAPAADTLCSPPWEPRSALVLSDVLTSQGTPVDEAPRSVLRHQIERLEERGLVATVASELEFYLFRTSYSDAHASAYQNLTPSYHLHADNDVLIAGYDEAFIGEVRRSISAIGIDIFASQGEGSEGQHEINLCATGALEMADRHAIYKHGAKALAQKRGYSATFMAKPATDVAGSSGHVHISLRHLDGRAALGEEALSAIGEAFLAGLVTFSPELILLHAPYANSYKRLQPGGFAPVNASWGWDNRTCMVRVLRRGETLRFEFRLPGADMNPYFSIAAIIAAGIEGIDQGLRVPEPVDGNAYERDTDIGLPRDLTEAVASLRNSEFAEGALTTRVYSHLVLLGERELEASRRSVTDWERARGFENA